MHRYRQDTVKKLLLRPGNKSRSQSQKAISSVKAAPTGLAVDKAVRTISAYAGQYTR